jgi:hypothetical protein
MEGIQYLVDDAGNRTAVVIDLEIHRELWEDFFDALLARERASEPEESLQEVESRLRHEGKLSA